MSAKAGHACKLYYNTATWASPTWAEIDLARDLTLPLSRDYGDASSRASDFKVGVVGLLDTAVNGQTIWDPSDAGFAALLDACLNGTTVELAIMDGDITTAGSEGLHADFYVTKCDRGEPLGDLVAADFEAKPAATANDPEWMTVAS